MPSTTPGGLPIPLDTDPFEDGALAVRNLADALDPAGGWTAYAPAWTASVTNPTLGNGSLTGQYRKVGKTVQYRISLQLGTTSVRGSGAYAFSLPVAARFTSTPCGTAYMRDSSAAANVFRFPIIAVAGTINLYDFANPAVAVTDSVPWLWANADQIVIVGTYEAA